MAKRTTSSTSKTTTRKTSSTSRTRKTSTAKSAPKKETVAEVEAPEVAEIAEAEAEAPAAPVPESEPAAETVAEAVAEPEAGTDTEADEAQSDAPVIKRNDLIDRTMAATGLKKKDVKPVVEALLKVLGEAIVAGETVQAPPLGKLMVKNLKDQEKVSIVTLRLRQSKPGADSNEALAESEE